MKTPSFLMESESVGHALRIWAKCYPIPKVSGSVPFGRRLRRKCRNPRFGEMEFHIAIWAMGAMMNKARVHTISDVKEVQVLAVYRGRSLGDYRRRVVLHEREIKWCPASMSLCAAQRNWY